EDFVIGAVRRQTSAVGEELIPADISGMVISNDNAPVLLGHAARLSADLAIRSNLLARLVAPEHIGAGVRWIRQDTKHSGMVQSTPEQLAIPSTAVRESEGRDSGSAGPRRRRYSPA